MIRVILWDIDNTLLSFNKAEKAALHKDFAEFSLGEFTEEMLNEYVVINKRCWQALERGEMTKLEVTVGRFVEFFTMYGIDTSIAPAFNERYQELLGEFIYFNDDAYEIIKDLKGKVLQCGATNGTKIAQTGKLKNSGLGELLDMVFISEDVGAEKPAKVFFDKAMADVEAKIGKVALDEVLMIGDSLTSDIKGANNAKIKACWYNPEGVPCDKDVQIDYEIKDLHEVYDILKENW